MAVNTIDQAGGMIHTQAIVSFYNGAQINQGKTTTAGRPIYDDVEMIRIQWAGNTKSELHAPANDRSDRPIVNPEDRTKTWPKWKEHPDFAKAYAAFKSGQASAMNGTPIAELPFLTDARRLELKAVNIHTAEQLAGLDHNTVQKLGMGIGQIKQQAQAYLERAAGAAVDAKHEAERSAMQAQIDELRALLTKPTDGAPVAPKPKSGPKAVAQVATEAASPVYQTFDSFADDELRAYLTEAGEVPHNRCGHASLVKMACDVDARLKAERVAA